VGLFNQGHLATEYFDGNIYNFTAKTRNNRHLLTAANKPY